MAFSAHFSSSSPCFQPSSLFTAGGVNENSEAIVVMLSEVVLSDFSRVLYFVLPCFVQPRVVVLMIDKRGCNFRLKRDSNKSLQIQLQRANHRQAFELSNVSLAPRWRRRIKNTNLDTVATNLRSQFSQPNSSLYKAVKLPKRNSNVSESHKQLFSRSQIVFIIFVRQA